MGDPKGFDAARQLGTALLDGMQALHGDGDSLLCRKSSGHLEALLSMVRLACPPPACLEQSSFLRVAADRHSIRQH